MTSIPGIGDGVDDYGEEERLLNSLHSSCKRPLSPDPNGEQRKKIHLDEDDLLLYGDESALTPAVRVNGMTLVTEKLPLKEADFNYRLLSHGPKDGQLSDLFSLVKQLPEVNAVNVFQVTFIACISLEAQKRMAKAAISEFRTFYIFNKRKLTDNMMTLSSFSPVSISETKKSFADFEKEYRLTKGQLVSVHIMPVDDTIEPVQTYGFITEHNRRLPDNCMRLEVDVRKFHKFQTTSTMIDDIELMVPLTDCLWRKSSFFLNVRPICLMSDLLLQVRAVYDIAANPLFKYIKSKDFRLAPTGTLVTSSDQKFSLQQLEAIQRAFDLVTQPVPVSGNPCQAVFVDGKPETICQTVVEIINQLLTNDLTNGHQYVVTSSDEALRALYSQMKSLLPDFKSSKLLLFVGHDTGKINSEAASIFTSTITSLRESDQNEMRNKKIAHFEKCLSLLKSNKKICDFESDVIETVGAFQRHALNNILKKARLIFSTLKDLSRSSEISQHLLSTKAYPSAPDASTPKARASPPISVCMIADADSLTDPELMVFSKEFSFTRFILTSHWFSGPNPSPKSQFSLDRNLSERLKHISQSADPPLVVDVGGDL